MSPQSFQAPTNTFAPGHPLAPLAQGWLPVWLDATGFTRVAAEIRAAQTRDAIQVIESLFGTLADQVAETVATLVAEDDEITEPMAVLESSEYILGSLPEAWLELIRETGRPGRIALVAQMALFICLLAEAANPGGCSVQALELARRESLATLQG